jgi:hypothetical protein
MLDELRATNVGGQLPTCEELRSTQHKSFARPEPNSKRRGGVPTFLLLHLLPNLLAALKVPHGAHSGGDTYNTYSTDPTPRVLIYNLLIR